jgi:hypothetical protein
MNTEVFPAIDRNHLREELTNWWGKTNMFVIGTTSGESDPEKRTLLMEQRTILGIGFIDEDGYELYSMMNESTPALSPTNLSVRKTKMRG